MADLPIPFFSPMVRALLREIETPGTGKTQTRRGNHLKRLRTFGDITEFGRSDAPGYDWQFRDSGMRWHDLRHGELLNVLPYRVGDRLYVREHWRVGAWLHRDPGGRLPDAIAVDYRADNFARREWLPCRDRKLFDRLVSQSIEDAQKEHVRPYRPDAYNWEYGKGPTRWRQSLFMPRWASRITLIVTDVRVGRLQDISEADAIAEGIERHKLGWMPYVTAFYDGDGITPANFHRDPRISYMQLWDCINGRGAWDANPWVAAYTFRPILGNIDLIGGQDG